MKGIILYTTKYGSTREYAQWIAAATNLPLHRIEDSQDIAWRDYEVIVLGSPVYASRLLIRKWLHANKAVLRDRILYLFVVCGAQEDEPERRMKYIDRSLPGELKVGTRIYFLRGRMEMKKLPTWLRWGMVLVSRFYRNPQIRKRIITDFDEVRQESIRSLLYDLQEDLALH